MSATSSNMQGQIDDPVPLPPQTSGFSALISRLKLQPGPWLKPMVFLACLAPFAYLIYSLFFAPRSLGANPIEALTDMTGTLAMRFLLICTCSCTPCWISNWICQRFWAMCSSGPMYLQVPLHCLFWWCWPSLHPSWLRVVSAAAGNPCIVGFIWGQRLLWCTTYCWPGGI